MFTLLFEILDPPDPTPRKRYLFCNDDRHPRRVTGCEYIHARNLAALLSHPEILVTVIEYATAIEAYTAIETATPSRETQPTDTRGTMSQPPTPCRGPWPDVLDARSLSTPNPRRAGRDMAAAGTQEVATMPRKATPSPTHSPRTSTPAKC